MESENTRGRKGKVKRSKKDKSIEQRVFIHHFPSLQQCLQQHSHITAKCASSLHGESFSHTWRRRDFVAVSPTKQHLFISAVHMCSVFCGGPSLPRQVEPWLRSWLASMTTESDLSLTSSRLRQPASLRLKTSSCCDWWEVQKVCNISEQTFHWSGRTCRTDPKKKDFCLVENPSSYFPVNRWQPAGRDGLNPTRDTWKKLWHDDTHYTQKLTPFSGRFPSGGRYVLFNCSHAHKVSSFTRF